MKAKKNTYMLTVEQVATIFGVEEQTVRDWAKKGELPAMKVGKNWYFARTAIFERQSINDAIELVGGQIGFSRSYDLLVDNERVEVKSTVQSDSRTNGAYWHFTGFHPAKMSDYYLLLGYDKNRTELLFVVKIPSYKLEERMPVIASRTNRHNPEANFEGCGFNIYQTDPFFREFVLYEKEEIVKGGEHK